MHFFLNLNLSWLSNLSPPSKYGTNFAAIILKLFSTLVNKEPFITLFIDMIKVMQNNGSTISSFHFKSSSEFFFLLHFQRTHQSSSYYCTFASHACNLGSHVTFFLSFNSFQVTIQHAIIVVHENCWDSLKGPPDFFTFMWYSCGMWVITKTFPAVQDVNGTSAKNLSRHAV